MWIWFGGIGLFVALLIAAVLISNVHVHVVFRKHKSDDYAKINVRMMYGEVLGSQQVNKRKVENWANEVKVMLKATEALKIWFKQTLKRVHITNLFWSTAFGVGDAAYTAMLSGWLWSIKSMIIGFLTYQMKFRTVPDLEVLPVWSDEMEFRMELDFKLQVRTLSIFVAGVRLLTRVLHVEGGWRMWLKLLKQERRKFKEKKKYKHIVDKEGHKSET